MGGTIYVESELGKGAMFTIEIQRKYGEAQPDKTAMQKDGIPFLAGKRILFCENNNINVMVARELLKNVCCIVDVVENVQLGADSFAKSAQGYYNAILMDIRMPEIDGLEATKAIRAFERADAKDIPIIAMCANAFDEDVKKSLDAGMNAHLSKPMDPQKLYETLGKQFAK